MVNHVTGRLYKDSPVAIRTVLNGHRDNKMNNVCGVKVKVNFALLHGSKAQRVVV